VLGETARLARWRSRAPERSLREYEARWSAQWAKLRRQPASDLATAVTMSSYGSRPLNALLEFVPYEISAPAFFRWRAAKLGRIFGAHYATSTPIAEIGCGLGKNLLALAYAGFTDLAGFDPTESAVRAVTEEAAYFGQPWRVGHGNLLDPDPGLLDWLSGRVLFTNHVIEQLPRHVPQALDWLCRAAPAEVLHFEPCVEFLRPARDLGDLAGWLHVVSADYQRSLLGCLRTLAADGQVELLEARSLGYSPRLTHAPALIRWRPRGRGNYEGRVRKCRLTRAG
jgi:SAM-dependent methyltransferase